MPVTTKPNLFSQKIGPLPRDIFFEDVAAADNRMWDISITGGVFSIRLLSDDGATATTALSITRSGTTVSNVSIPNTGELFPDGTAAAPSISFTSETNSGWYRSSSLNVSLSIGGSPYLTVNGNIGMAANTSFGWTATSANSTGSLDVILARDAANTLALKNGTTAQEFRVYGTTTNSRYLTLSDDGTNGILNTSGGTIVLRGGGGASGWGINSSQVLFPEINGQADIGTSSLKVRAIYSGSLGSTGVGVGQYFADSTDGATVGNQTINKTAGSVLFAAAAGKVTVTNSLVTASSRIFAVIATSDATAKIGNIIPGAGTFDINLVSPGATAATRVSWFIVST